MIDQAGGGGRITDDKGVGVAAIFANEQAETEAAENGADKDKRKETEDGGDDGDGADGKEGVAVEKVESDYAHNAETGGGEEAGDFAEAVSAEEN